jgi:hypothetical protein
MANVILVKDEQGRLTGLGEKGARAWAKFRSTIESLVVGETIEFSWWAPRSPQFHRLHFAMLGAFFEAQDQFQDFEAFRMWVQVGAGFCDLLPGPKGKPVAIPRSIAWRKLDDNDFAEHHLEVVKFLRTEYVPRFLWPWLSDREGMEMVESILREFDR